MVDGSVSLTGFSDALSQAYLHPMHVVQVSLVVLRSLGT